MKTNGKYEFIIEYPGDVYYRWRQSKNPVKEYETQSRKEAAGFESIHQEPDEKEIKGLVRTTIKVDNEYISTFLDGCPGESSWYFAIGMYKDSKPNYLNRMIPGYKENVEYTKLWVKIDPKGRYRQCTFSATRYTPTYPLFLLLFIVK